MFSVHLGFNLVQSNYQAALLEDIRDKQYPVQIRLQEAFLTLRLIQVTMREAVRAGEMETLRELDAFKKQFLDSIVSVQMIDSSENSTIDAITSAFTTYFDANYQLAVGLHGGKPENIPGIDGEEIVAASYSKVAGLLEAFKSRESIEYNLAISGVTRRANSIVRIGVPVGMLVVAVLFYLAVLTSRRVIERINNIVGALRNIARDNGDMSVRIPVDGVDEMAEMAFWFNRFVSKLERLTNESTEEIRRLAYADSLTRLPNRRLFNKHLKSEVVRCQRKNETMAVMFLDLDDFKSVNDQLGHDAGDALICEVAQRLTDTMRDYDIVARDIGPKIGDGDHLVARMGGDEFMVIVTDLEEPQHAAVVAERVRKIILEPIKLNGTSVDIGVSIGIAIYPDNGMCAEELVINADLAMYEAKNRGKNNYCFFNCEMENAARFNIQIESALRGAFKRDELELHYQPKFNVESGEMVGAEALLRWHSPSLGMVSPARFVPLAEKSGLIYVVDSWVLQTVCTQIHDWREAGFEVAPISINVSAKQAARSDLVDIVSTALQDASLPPYAIEVEITETSALLNMQVVAENIRLLKKLSVTVALDDFGAGHSSLSLLKYCDIDTLKIDRGFITELGVEGRGRPLVEAVVTLAKILGLCPVAEGVEQVSELEALREMECTVAQGYYFARPMPVDEFEQFMRDQTQLKLRRDAS